LKSDKEYHAEVFKELQDTDILNKYIAYLWGGAELTDKQKETFQRFQFVCMLYTKGYRTEKIVKILMKGFEEDDNQIPPFELNLTEHNARKVIHYAKQIWGNPEQIHNEFERWASIQFHEETAKMAREAGDYNAAIRAKKEADTLKGLYIQSEGGADPNDFNPKNFQLFPTDKFLDENTEAILSE